MRRLCGLTVLVHRWRGWFSTAWRRLHSLETPVFSESPDAKSRQESLFAFMMTSLVAFSAWRHSARAAGSVEARTQSWSRLAIASFKSSDHRALGSLLAPREMAAVAAARMAFVSVWLASLMVVASFQSGRSPRASSVFLSNRLRRGVSLLPTPPRSIDRAGRTDGRFSPLTPTRPALPARLASYGFTGWTARRLAF